MSKSRVILLSGILLPIFLVGTIMVWRDMQAFDKFTQYFSQVSMVMDTSAEKNEIGKEANYRQEVESLNQEMAGRMERIYGSSANGENIDTAISLTRGLFEELFKLRAEFAMTVEPFMSERMRDRKTVKDKESYKWRSEVLDSLDEYLSVYHVRVEKIIEDFRQAVSTSNLPEKYKKFIWQDWGGNLHSRLSKLGPDVENFQSEVTDYRRLFKYLHEYSDVYYVNDEGRIVISNNRHLKEYQSIAKSVSQEWW
jgi:hypothetical protein